MCDGICYRCGGLATLFKKHFYPLHKEVLITTFQCMLSLSHPPQVGWTAWSFGFRKQFVHCMPNFYPAMWTFIGKFRRVRNPRCCWETIECLCIHFHFVAYQCNQWSDHHVAGWIPQKPHALGQLYPIPTQALCTDKPVSASTNAECWLWWAVLSFCGSQTKEQLLLCTSFVPALLLWPVHGSTELLTT